MAPFLSRLGSGGGTTAGFGFGKRKALALGTSRINIFGLTPTLLGTVPGSGLYYQLSPSPITNSQVIYAMRQTAEPNGTGTMYVSSNYGVTWTTGASVTGGGSAYGFGLVSISDTIVAMQHRAYFYRSTNSGSTFSTILTTSSGQNNFFTMSWDGTYGICGGYDQNVYTNNSWQTATTGSNGSAGISMSTVPLTSNGNVFLKAGLGSSGSPNKAYHTNNSLSSITEVISALGNADSFVASNTVHGGALNFVIGRGSTDLWYATYPSTSYTNVTMPVGTSGYATVTKSGILCFPTSSGVYKYTTGGSFTQVSATTTAQDVKSITGTDSVVYILGDGSVYGVDLI